MKFSIWESRLPDLFPNTCDDMGREIIGSVELQRLITEALRAVEDGYDDCQFTGIVKYREPDDENCNWSPPSFVATGRPGDL